MNTTWSQRARRIAVGSAAAAMAIAPMAIGLPPASAAVVAPTVLLPNMVVPEGDSGNAAFTVNVGLSAPNPFDHAVTLHVVDYSAVTLPGGGTYGTARAGSDYVAFGDFNLTFQPGQQVARFTIKIKGDNVVEGQEEIDVRFDDTEFFVGDNDIDLVISNDDGTPKPTLPLLGPPNQTTPEPDSGCYVYQVTIPISRPAGKKQASVDAVDYTGVWTPGPTLASAGSDYITFPTKKLTYLGVSTRVANLPIKICGDTAVEGNEEIDVRFDNTTTIAIGDNDIDLILSNDD